MKLYKIIIVASLLAIGISLLYMFFILKPSYRATNLRVDYIRVPEYSVINSKSPIFSWNIAPNAKAQSAYQIVVRSVGDSVVVWDSGMVESRNSSCVVYGGEDLQAGERYRWMVRYWDMRGRERGYSHEQEFRMREKNSSDHNDGSIVTDNPIFSREDRPIAMTQLDDSVFLFDFGKAAFGNLRLKLRASNMGDSVYIRVGEQLDSMGRVSRRPSGTSVYSKGTYIFTDTTLCTYDLVMAADKRNTGAMAIPVPDSMGVIFPFRYVEICNLNPQDSAVVEPIRKVIYGYKEDLSNFNSSDSTLNDVWELCKYTIQATDLFGYYIDGDRERIPYEADAYLNQLSHYCIDSEYAIGKKTLEYFMSHATWPTEWLLHTPMIAYQDYIYTGDTRMVECYYDMLKMKSLYELSREDGLISSSNGVIDREYMAKLGYKPGGKPVTDIVDWPPAEFSADGVGERDYHDMRAYNTVVNCFFYHTMTIMAEIATVLNKQEDVELFSTRAEMVKVAINDKLFNIEEGIYVDGEGSTHSSLHSNMMALAFDIVPAEHVKSVVEYVKSRGLVCSVYGAQYLLEALYRAGEDQYALDIMTNTSRRSWYNMIKIGSTMTLEAWDSYYKLNLDWNHAWGAAPANIIPRMMWGVTPAAPAYQKATIKPQLANLTSSEIVVPTLLGAIKCSYKVVDKVKYYEVEIPANMDAQFDVGRDAGRDILFNGEAFSDGDPTLHLQRGVNKLEIR